MIARGGGVSGAIKFLIVQYSLKFFYLERFTRRNKKYCEEFCCIPDFDIFSGSHLFSRVSAQFLGATVRRFSVAPAASIDPVGHSGQWES